MTTVYAATYGEYSDYRVDRLFTEPDPRGACAGRPEAIEGDLSEEEIVQAVRAREGVCHVYWGSHGCELFAGHEGDHICLTAPPERDQREEDGFVQFVGPGHLCLYTQCWSEPRDSPQLYRGEV